MPIPNDRPRLIMEIWPMISKAIAFALGAAIGSIVAWRFAKAWYRRNLDIAEQRQKAAEDELARRESRSVAPTDKPPAPLRVIAQQEFRNQLVPLDGIEYVGCTFRTVTFVYNGIAPFAITAPFKIEGQLVLTTEAERIVPLLRLLEGFQREIPPLAFLVPSGR
jgi:hypothetical protein